MNEVMLIIEGEKVAYHLYKSNIQPIAGDVITISDNEVFTVKRRLLGGIDNSNKIICFGILE